MQNEFEKYVKKHLNHTGLIGDQIIESSLTPYILEEREMRVTQMDIFSRLMADRIIWISGAIDDNTSSIVQAQLLFLESLDKTKDASLYLDTPGGSVKAGLSIVDSMENATFDVATVNTGMCASMGAVLLGAGTRGKRSSLRFSKVMVHQVSSGASGHVADNRINHNEAEKYNFILFQKIAEYSGKTWKEVLDYSERDRWLTSDEAKNYGLIDEVILKDGSKSVTELLEDFDEYEQYVKRNG